MRPTTDTATGAFRHALALGTAGVALLALVGALLGPIGALSHLWGFATRMCVTLPHLVSDAAALLLVLVTGGGLLLCVTSVAAGALLQRRLRLAWHPATGTVRRRAMLAARRVGARARVVVFAAPEPIACSRGLARPSVWISTGAIERLDDAQLAAVLAHEQRHCDRRDPARHALLALLERSLFAFPVMAAAAREFRRQAEFAADDAARRAAGRRAAAGALLRFADAPSRQGGAVAAVGFGAHGASVGERVGRLLGQDLPRTSARRAWRVSAAVATVVACALLAVALLPAM